MTDSIDISKKVYEAEDIQKLLGLGRSKTYEFLDAGEIKNLRISG